MTDIRSRLVSISLEWERVFVNAPSVTTALSEYDAAMLLGLTEAEYSHAMLGSTSVQRGFDFKFNDIRYQVKGTRPSGKPGSKITRVPKARDLDWDQLIWVCYSPDFEILEAWLWTVQDYAVAFSRVERLSPEHMRQGKRLAL